MSESVQPVSPPTSAEQSLRTYLRFERLHRIEHWVFMVSFTTLGITGLVQKYSASPLSQAIVTGLGGIESTRLIHHIAATLMMLVVVYHIGAIIYRLYVQRLSPTMLPGVRDAINAMQALGYYFGNRKNQPQQARYTFEEKIEYWAVVWGTAIMVITGFMMWNPIATTNILPGQIVPAAKAAHGAEAVLAILAIIIWHLYHVLVKTFNRSMFNGKLSEEQMLHEHPLELADIKAGLDKPATSPEGIARRKRIFFPVYSVVAAVLTFGIVYFVTFEDTAIVTVPPSEAGEVEVFVPLTPTPLPTPLPSPTPAAEVALVWEGGIGPLLESKCGGCHNGSSLIGGLDLTTYQGALKGGNSGPAVVPGDGQAGTLIQVQSAGGHPGQLTEEELAQVSEWIAAGAPEN
jgi:formate dehydrogenase gamma subunit